MRSPIYFTYGEDRMPHPHSNQTSLFLKSAKRGHVSSAKSFAQQFFEDFLWSQTGGKLSLWSAVLDFKCINV